MSLFRAQFRFLTLRPSLRVTPDRLVIRTGMLTRCLSLFLRLTSVEIEPGHKTVTIRRRTGYLFRSSRTLLFEDVAYVDYAFGAVGRDWGWTSTGIGRHDQFESFVISLVTHDGRRYPLCAFRGEGAACSGWTGVLLGDDDIVDMSGTQEQESRLLARNIARVLGVPIGKPIEAGDAMVACPQCGRQTTSFNPRCLYCGARLAPVLEQSDP